MSVDLVPGLAEEYSRLWASCSVRPAHFTEINAVCDRAVSRRARYEAVGSPMGIPWFFVAVIHQMESGGSFFCHLHNGDPLTARTVQVPAGRPLAGDPPFTWEQSALDALEMKHLAQWHDWGVPGILYRLEGYNGFGYRLHHPEVLSPYLWSYSSHYTTGKYVADGRWDPEAVSRQSGAATILRRMQDRGMIALTETPPATSPVA